MQVEQWPLEKLIHYANNPRKNDQAVEQVAAAIHAFGFRVPIIAKSDGTIVDGHLRAKAAAKLNLKTVPVVLADDMTDTQIKAFRLSVNRMAELAEWDNELLKLELDDLKLEDFDLELTGFDDDFLKDLEPKPEGLTDPDDVPELKPDPKSKLGDVWLLGNHRVMCGDSTDAASVAILMNGKNADLCFTSPPYGQQRDYLEAKEHVSDWDKLMSGVFAAAILSEKAQVLVNLGMIHRDNEWQPYWDKWIQWMRESRWRRFGMYVWDQGFGLPGDWSGRMAPSFELVFHFNKESKKPNKFLEKNAENVKKRNKGQSTMRGKDGKLKDFSSPEASAQTHKIPDSVIRINRASGGHGIDHPAIFPVELPEFFAKCYDGLMFEPFCGSGTTLIAAEKLGRHCYGMELSPQYVDVIIKRWQDFTGKKAIREDGVSFDSL